MESKPAEPRHSLGGFTLIELMVAVAIVAVLASIAVPLYQRYVYAAEAAEVLTRIDALREEAALYHEEHGWPRSLTEPPPLNSWPAPVSIGNGNLQVSHLQAVVRNSAQGLPIAIFHGTDRTGQHILDAAAGKLPPRIIYAHQAQHYLSVYLIDASPSGNGGNRVPQNTGGTATDSVGTESPPSTMSSPSGSSPDPIPTTSTPVDSASTSPAETKADGDGGGGAESKPPVPATVASIERQPRQIPSACYGPHGQIHYHNPGHYSMCPRRGDVVNGVWYP